jgi:hypothetical protein
VDRFGEYFGFELRLSPRVVVVALIVVAMLITLGHDTAREDADWWQWGRLVLWLYALSLVIWLLDRWQPQVCRWFTAIALIVSVHLGDRWLDALQYLSLVGYSQMDYPYMMAVSTIITLPIVIAFFFTQRSFIEGISLTGLKG